MSPGVLATRCRNLFLCVVKSGANAPFFVFATKNKLLIVRWSGGLVKYTKYTAQFIRLLRTS